MMLKIVRLLSQVRITQVFSAYIEQAFLFNKHLEMVLVPNQRILDRQSVEYMIYDKGFFP